MVKQKELTFNQIKNTAYLYEGCGNRLLVVHLTHNFDREDVALRHNLRRLGLLRRADSVLVLTGNPSDVIGQGYHVTMDVFEPRGKDINNPLLPGSWSTMCGNGIRAVSRYLLDSGLINCFIQTRSGNRVVSLLSQNQFRVCMGEFTMLHLDLNRYVRRYDFNQLTIPYPNLHTSNIIVGLNGNRINGSIDGEPHLIIILERNITNMHNLIRLCNSIGPKLTNNRDYFPETINTSIVSIGVTKNNEKSVMACTFERGVEYVTQACGTAATVIGSYLLSQRAELEAVHVRMPGGSLIIESDAKKQYYMTGSANPIE